MLEQVCVAVLDGNLFRAHAIAALVTVGAMVEQRLDDCAISAHRSPVEQRAAPIALGTGQKALAIIIEKQFVVGVEPLYHGCTECSRTLIEGV